MITSISSAGEKIMGGQTGKVNYQTKIPRFCLPFLAKLILVLIS